jgi:hypothetical protein
MDIIPLALKNSNTSTVPGNKRSPDHRTPDHKVNTDGTLTVGVIAARLTITVQEKYLALKSALDYPTLLPLPIEELTHVELIEKFVNSGWISRETFRK